MEVVEVPSWVPYLNEAFGNLSFSFWKPLSQWKRMGLDFM